MYPSLPFPEGVPPPRHIIADTQLNYHHVVASGKSKGYKLIFQFYNSRFIPNVKFLCSNLWPGAETNDNYAQRINHEIMITEAHFVVSCSCASLILTTHH